MLSCRKSIRVVVRVVTVNNFDQVNSTLQCITFRKHHYVPQTPYTYHPQGQICPFSTLRSRSNSVNSFLKNSISVVIRMLESSSCGNGSNELDYTLYKLDQLVSLSIQWQIVNKDSLLEDVLDLLMNAYNILVLET